ncbi:helix-turn-helix transcriptional regulator [Anatilimnocola floriformis]|uniref:helix-turn-helix transcriptional regulator n=1 Tax=Anatilimnocola floriformis TaxID=2948575 RepID=UPI0020C38D69|nr:transcriptional regulator [Anatilimnocola floriformis]
MNLIQSRGRWNAKSIAEELNCSERTIYRDLEVLEFSGVPWYFDDEGQCYRVRPDYKFPVLGLTDDELLGQALATAATNSPGLDVNAGAAPTTRKIAAASSTQAKQILADAEALVSVLDLKLVDHSRHHEAIKTVQISLLERRQLSGTYDTPYEPRPLKLKLHPFRLTLIKNAWYLVARPHDEVSPRTYRVARFKTLRTLGEAAVVPEDFSLRSYLGNAWGVYRGEVKYDVKLHFPNPTARIVTETTWHHSQKADFQRDGSVILSFLVDGLEEIANWVLSWTGRCRILQPMDLRNRVNAQLQAGLAMNT